MEQPTETIVDTQRQFWWSLVYDKPYAVELDANGMVIGAAGPLRQEQLTAAELDRLAIPTVESGDAVASFVAARAINNDDFTPFDPEVEPQPVERRHVEPEPVERVQQEPLLDVDDEPIAPLHTAATRYAALRDRRMALTKAESALKGEILALMTQHEQTHYACGGVDIRLVVEEATVKVRVTPAADADPV